jgi:hypothetical protein
MIHPHESNGKTRAVITKRPLVTREMVEARTRELASMGGRNAHQVTRTDYERAKREITGESDRFRQEDLIESPAFWRPDMIHS